MKTKVPITPLSVMMSVAFLLLGYCVGRILEKRETEKVREAFMRERMQHQELMSRTAVAHHESQMDRLRAEYMQKQASTYRSQLEKANIPYKSEPPEYPGNKRYRPFVGEYPRRERKEFYQPG